ncbi:signal transduction histidine kinase [Natranaerovirga pectinivora]|uniref:histidine kinase n=1 Tax=Natranaerovirga pectinivora TaxID=682400 RepID=A0A4R3MMN7_9FIRM|nr:sensor histidine kinase [Natranaerovirga pectinivora]TCT16225.1 signal transduction histidine kinase [Natranaerovirga pectinivora]
MKIRKKLIMLFFKEIRVALIAIILIMLINFLYYRLEYNVLDLTFPIITFFTILLIYIGYEWFHFYPLMRCVLLKESLEHKPNEYYKPSYLQIIQYVEEMHNEVLNRQNEILNTYQSEKYIIAQFLHNMKSPLTVMKLYNERFGPVLVEEALQYHLYIKQECDQLNELLDGTLNILRLNEFAKDLMPTKVKIYDSIKKAINQRQSSFLSHQVYPILKFNEDQKKIKVITDEKWNGVILDQILSNAIKFSYECKKEKSIHIYVEEREKNFTLCIKDNGIGIPNYDIKRVFEVFFTGENGRKVPRSTGVGLFLCHQICSKLNQDINIESQVEMGTCVKITYPIAYY